MWVGVVGLGVSAVQCQTQFSVRRNSAGCPVAHSSEFLAHWHMAQRSLPFGAVDDCAARATSMMVIFRIRSFQSDPAAGFLGSPAQFSLYFWPGYINIPFARAFSFLGLGIFPFCLWSNTNATS